jgi:hypothetical protein
MTAMNIGAIIANSTIANPDSLWLFWLLNISNVSPDVLTVLFRAYEDLDLPWVMFVNNVVMSVPDVVIAFVRLSCIATSAAPQPTTKPRTITAATISFPPSCSPQLRRAISFSMMSPFCF